MVSGGGDEPVDFGFVGDIEAVDTALVEGLGSLGVVPVLNSLGADTEGNVLNINADIAATRLAVALKAEALFLLTGASGCTDGPGGLGDAYSCPGSGKRHPVHRRGDHRWGNDRSSRKALGLRGWDSDESIFCLRERPEASKEWDEPGSVGTVLVD